jgi:hypothetical protein
MTNLELAVVAKTILFSYFEIIMKKNEPYNTFPYVYFFVSNYLYVIKLLSNLSAY